MKADVIHGDCLDVLRTLAPGSVDIVVTSPPYNTLPPASARGGSGMHRGLGWLARAAGGYTGDADRRPELEYQEWMRVVVAECLRVTQGLVWVNHKTRFRDGVGIHPLSFLPFPYWSEVVWDRGVSMVLNARKFAPSHEYVFGFGRPHWWDDNQNIRMSVWRMGADVSNDGHPCAFPVAIPARCILASCPPGGMVLDPFCGSGTTGVACVREGRAFLGIEREESYVAIARRRIAEAQAQGTFDLSAK